MSQRIANRYHIISEIGKGGMGTVYLGMDEQLQIPVVVKRLKPDLNNPLLIERFRREGEALRTLNHPNIVKMLDTVEQDGEHYLILEYMLGGDLNTLMKTGPLPISRVISIALDLCDALTRAHRLNIFHRDLKPGNILLDSDLAPRLTDFGVAHIERLERVTDSGALIGTVDYMAPEALQADIVDARTDLWSFGVVLFEMLSGRRPFHGNSVGQLITSILFDPLPDLEALRPDCPTPLVDLVYRMLDKDPNTRISSARLVGLELEALLHERPITSVSSPRPTVTRFDDTALTGAKRHNLPSQPTPFVGRAAELLALAQQLTQPDIRLLTILAPGGMGKTRLALQAAEERLSDFRDGVYFVALAGLQSPDMLLPAIAEVVGYPFEEGEHSDPYQQLSEFLADRHLLLVLDNFEHMHPAATTLETLLVAAPRLKLLVTSRERLNLSAEVVFPLLGMEIPDRATEHALDYSGLRLFIQSAGRVAPGFVLNEEDIPAVTTICQLVGGMPLGILLAASWVILLSPAEIAREMQASLDFLQADWRDLPERHRNLRAVFDYAWKLLNEDERDALMRLSIFRGGFTREAAQTITGVSLRTLLTLLQKSLITRDNDGGRYQMHELIRQYAAERLTHADLLPETARAHSRFYLTFTRRLGENYPSVTEKRAIRAMETEADNIHAAWQFAIEQKAVDLIEDGAASVDLFYRAIHWYQEGKSTAERALACLPGQSLAAAELLKAAGSCCYSMDLIDECETYAQQALALFRQHEDTRGILKSINLIGLVNSARGSLEAASAYYAEGLALAEAVQQHDYLATFMNNLAYNAWWQQDYAEARHLIDRYLPVIQQGGNTNALALTLQILAYTLYAERDIAGAKAAIHRWLAIKQEQEDDRGIAGALVFLATLHMQEGDYAAGEDFSREAADSAGRIGDALLIVTAESLAVVGMVLQGRTAEAQPLFQGLLARSRTLGMGRGLQRGMTAVPFFYVGIGQPVRAVEYMSMLLNLPNLEPTLINSLTILRAQLEAQFPPEAFQAAWERGKTLDLRATAHALAAEWR